MYLDMVTFLDRNRLATTHVNHIQWDGAAREVKGIMAGFRRSWKFFKLNIIYHPVLWSSYSQIGGGEQFYARNKAQIRDV